MNSTQASLRINASRFKDNFEALARIGSTGDGGVNRPSFSPAHLQARQWYRQRVEEANLAFHGDSAGNHTAVLSCGPASGPTLLLGSHLDSVPHGGCFDGALGVLAALEVLQTIQDAGLSLPVNLEAIDFSDEEGTLVGLLGSRALAGELARGDLRDPRGGRAALETGLQRAGLSEEGLLQAARPGSSLAGYLELHIEQGERVHRAGADLGIVTTIVGIGSYRITFIGRADHAGTTPMETRLDAAQGASAFTLACRQLVLDTFPACVANVGKIEAQPGAFNIVPARVTLALEYRAPETAAFARIEGALLELAEEQARCFNLEVEAEKLAAHPPTPMSQQVQTAIQEAADTLGLRALPLTSRAGHDAQSLAAVCPAGMVFVPSVGGVSHAPAEFTEWTDCVNGANILLQAALNLAGKMSF
jgi:N-carbamoyl-L-amino-acid hydrolase